MIQEVAVVILPARLNNPLLGVEVSLRVDDSQNLTIFDPEATWKQKEVYNFTAKELQVPIFIKGELVYKLPSLPEIREYCRQQVDTLWDEVKRFDNPHSYYVDLSQKLWEIKYALLKNNAGGNDEAQR